MMDVEQREAARQFVSRRTGAPIGWIFGQFHGMKNPTERVSFEKKVVVDGNTKRIDVYIPETPVLIEQAGKGLTTC